MQLIQFRRHAGLSPARSLLGCGRRAALALALAPVVACVVARSEASSPPASEDTALFVAAVRSMVSRYRDTLSVDPRPLRADSAAKSEDFEMFAEPRRLVADVPRSVVDARSAVLGTLGVPAGDAVVISNCPGTGNPHPTPEARRSCPAARKVIAILSVPRRDSTARLAADSGRMHPAGKRSYWLIRALEIEADSKSRVTLVVNYLMGQSGNGWEVVKRDPVFVLE